MNILLEQLKAAEAIEDETMVNLIRKQIAYINYEHINPEDIRFNVSSEYSKKTWKPTKTLVVKRFPSFNKMKKGDKRKALLEEFRKKS